MRRPRSNAREIFVAFASLTLKRMMTVALMSAAAINRSRSSHCDQIYLTTCAAERHLLGWHARRMGWLQDFVGKEDVSDNI